MHTQAKYLTRQPVFDRAKSLVSVVHDLLGERDLEILRLTFEQRAIRFDQLAHLCGISVAAVTRSIDRLSSAHLVDTAQLESDRSPWTWSTRPAMVVVAPQLEKMVKFAATPPPLSTLRHLTAATEVRLQYARTRPSATYISERMLWVLKGHSRYRPDAVLETAGERHAIEFELTLKSRIVLVEKICELTRIYDEVHYFVSDSTRHLLQQVQAANEWPNLIIHDLPEMP